MTRVPWAVAYLIGAVGFALGYVLRELLGLSHSE